MEQGEMNLGLMCVPNLKMIPEWEIKACKTEREAFRLCMRESQVKRPQEDWARLLNKSPGEFSLIFQDQQTTKRKRHLPAEWIDEIEMLAGNMAITQWYAYKRNKKLEDIDYKQKQIKQLEGELERLKVQSN